MPARALELSVELRQQGTSVLVGPSLVGDTARRRPVRHGPDLVRLDWTSVRRRRLARSMNRKLTRSVAARPPSRLLTGTSLGSEPVVLTAPAWGNETTSGTPGSPGKCRSGNGTAPDPDKRFAAADGLQARREVLAAAVRKVKPATSKKNRRFSVTVRAALS